MENERRINQVMQWLEEQDIRDELKSRGKQLNYHKLFLKAYLIKSIAVYLTISGNGETDYSTRIRGMAQMLLFICDEFNYLDKRQIANYKKILYKNNECS